MPIQAIQHTDNLCCDIKHAFDLDKYASDIIDALLSASQAALPITTNRHFNVHRILGWNEVAEANMEKPALWHNIWVQCDRPRSGCVGDTMGKTWAAYHYVIQSVRQNESYNVHQCFADAILSKNNHVFWKEAKKITNHNCSTTGVIDGYANSVNTAHSLDAKYETSYNEVSFSASEMSLLRTELHIQICSTNILVSDSLSAGEVANAIEQLKFHKRDGF